MKTLITSHFLSVAIFLTGLYCGTQIPKIEKSTKIVVGSCVKMTKAAFPFVYVVNAIRESEAELEMAPGLSMMYPLNELVKVECPE